MRRSKLRVVIDTEPARVTQEVERIFGDSIDLFGSGDPPKGVTSVDTTLAVPGPLVDPGCPLHGVGCPDHCPILRAVANVTSDPRFLEMKASVRSLIDEVTALSVAGMPPKGSA